ncbi:MAG: hypothetical protein JSV80_00835 [Acidobacteriota bacterium]|nr:MAG: hypothetical protein JSV80_00835 [Acidobacteriota bacterium]
MECSRRRVWIIAQLPYLTGPARGSFDAWLEGNLARQLETLTFTEIRKGVQALIALYTERPPHPQLAQRALEGRGKRAALATYFAALHFLTAHHATVMVEPQRTQRLGRMVDLGCGTGASGAAVAASLGCPRVWGVDRSRWALDEAINTWACFGLEGRAVKASLPHGFPRTSVGDLLVIGWLAGELEEGERVGLLSRVRAALRRGSSLLLLEPPSASRHAWWPAWLEALSPLGVRDELIRVAIERPRFVREMDTAARLDHQVIGAQVLVGGGGAGGA